MIQKLPMSFDWRKAKQNGQQIGFGNTNINMINKYNSPELLQSLIGHIDLQVKTTTDIEGYNACGKNPYIYVVNNFINKMLIKYYNMHSIDSDGIMYIVNYLQNDKDNKKFLNKDGLLEQAKEYVDHIEICPKLIVKAIVDKCM